MNKHRIVCIVIIVLFALIYCIPVKAELIWINDSDIYEVGHYEKQSYNLFGVMIHSKYE